MNEDMIKHFQCPVCVVLMKPPIYICVKGHSYCNSCRELRKVCGLCLSNLCCSRNYVLENLTAYIEYPCKFEQCDYKTLLKNLEKHQTKCTFRPYSCPTGSNCEWNGSFGNMLKHIEEKHKSQLCISNDKCFSFDKLTPNKLIINFNKRLFSFTVEIDTNFLNVSLKRICRTRSKQYKFNVRFVDKNNIEDVTKLFTKFCQNYSENTSFQIPIQLIEFAKGSNKCYKAQLKMSRV